MLKNLDKHKKHLKKVDPVLREVVTRIELPPRTLHKNYFQALAQAIISQQLSTKAAATIRGRVVALFGAKKFPTPDDFLKMPDKKLRAAGLSHSKISYIKNLARFYKEHEEEFKNLKKLSDEEIIAMLVQIKGVGKWTAEMFLIFTLGREDVFSHGDLGLRNAIKKLYKLRKDPSERRTKQISDKWKPYRSAASLYLWASLDNG